MKDVYVITGATGGMGVDLAKKITKNGIVMLVDLNKEKLEQLKLVLEKAKIEADYMVCDVSDSDKINQLVKRVAQLGHFKALIHTAGVSESMGNSKKILEINLIGTKLLMDAFYTIADDSTVILISSITGHMVPSSKLYDNVLVNPFTKKFKTIMSLLTHKNSGAAYAFSKKGVIMLTEKEVGKWALKNSRILSVSPGAIETPLAKMEAEKNPAVEYMISQTPIPRYGQPEEITELVKFLLSDKAEFINGTDILIDGGITSHMKYHDIFRLKEQKTDWGWPLIIYILLFLVLPVVVKPYFSDYSYTNYLIVSLFMYNPIMIALVTLLSTKKKISGILVLFPMLIFSISCWTVHNAGALIYVVIYGIIAYMTNFIVKVAHEAEE